MFHAMPYTDVTATSIMKFCHLFLFLFRICHLSLQLQFDERLYFVQYYSWSAYQWLITRANNDFSSYQLFLHVPNVCLQVASLVKLRSKENLINSKYQMYTSEELVCKCTCMYICILGFGCVAFLINYNSCSCGCLSRIPSSVVSKLVSSKVGSNSLRVKS